MPREAIWRDARHGPNRAEVQRQVMGPAVAPTPRSPAEGGIAMYDVRIDRRERPAHFGPPRPGRRVGQARLRRGLELGGSGHQWGAARRGAR